MSELFSSFARLKPIRTIEELVLAQSLAKEDNHPIIEPSHIVMKEGTQIGSFSVNSIPVWFGHLSIKNTNPHDTFRLIHAVETIFQSNGVKSIMTFVGKESRLHPKMSDLGYQFVSNADIFVKEFK